MEKNIIFLSTKNQQKTISAIKKIAKTSWKKNETKQFKRKIINSVGAGDAFCAAFIYGIHESWDIKKTLKKAHAAGSTMMKVDSSSGNLPNIQKL